MDYKYLVLPTVLLDSVDYSEIQQDSEDTVRKSADGLLFIVSYEKKPLFAADIDYPEYTHEEALALMKTTEWIIESEIDNRVWPNDFEQ